MSTETPSKRQHRPSRSTANTVSGSHSSVHPQNHHHPVSNSIPYPFESNTTVMPTTTPPRTPRKHSPSSTQTKLPSNTVDGSGRQRNKLKNRPKNVNVSPAVQKEDRQTPPLTSAGLSQSTSARPVTTPLSTAYAGPTFHASPAPSALPIPSFYSKSVPESPAARLLHQKREVSQQIANENPDASLSKQSEVNREESPLDFFFKLDREEKARARSASSTQQYANATGPFPPPTSPRSSQTPPAQSGGGRHQSDNRNRYSGGGMFAFEMESPTNSRTQYGPAFSTPYNERINAARSSSYSQFQQHQVAQSSSPSTDRSALLKDYLFNGNPPQMPSPQPEQPAQQPIHNVHRDAYNNNQRWGPNPPMHTPRNNAQFSGLRQEVTPTKTPTKTPEQNDSVYSTPTPSRQPRAVPTITGDGSAGPYAQNPSNTSGFPGSFPTSRNADMNGLETHLRQILNLNSPGSSEPKN